jgi:hypothetical protein
MIDYEIVRDKDSGEFEVWTPDTTGAILGSGLTVEAAMQDVVKNCEAFVAEIQKGKWTRRGFPNT